MRYLTSFRLAPGTENSLAGWDMFQKLGMPPNALAAYAGIDGKTFVAINDGEIDTTFLMSFTPFYDQVTVLPVVEVDETWVAAAGAAVANLGG